MSQPHLPVLLLLLLGPIGTIGDAECSFYVSYVAGSDNNTGTSPSAAFKGIQTAVDVASHSTSGKTVCLLSDGTHYLGDNAINIAGYNSGTKAEPVRIIGCPADLAAGQGRPIVSGAVSGQLPLPPSSSSYLPDGGRTFFHHVGRCPERHTSLLSLPPLRSNLSRVLADVLQMI
jgi:hypothetical protein